MAKAINLGFPRIGANRELKKATEAYWAGNVSREELLDVARTIRSNNWELQQRLGIDHVPVGDFSHYDHVLDAAFALNLIPKRFRELKNLNDLDLYFAMARGSGTVAPLEMTKWFDTNYHYLVPEFETATRPHFTRSFLTEQFLEASGVLAHARPVVLGPFSLLLLSKTRRDGTRPLNRLDGLLPAYEELLDHLKTAGADWVQIDEPALVLDLDAEQRDLLRGAMERLAGRTSLKIFLATYFGGLGENLDCALHLPVRALHLDLVRAPEQLDDALRNLPHGLTLSLGLVDGRNIWKTNLGEALRLAERAADELTPERLCIGPSCSLLHVPVDLASERTMPPELKDWMAFGQQKLEEIVVIKRAINEGAGAVQAALEANRESLDRRKTSRLTANPALRARLASLTPADFRRDKPYTERSITQRAVLQLPVLPTTTIGSFPQTAELRRQRARRRKGEIDIKEYEQYIRGEIVHVIAQQEEIGLDVLVHGEPERNDMVEYFGELLDGFAFTENGWVQSYGSRCVKPPIIFGDVVRTGPMTVKWWQYAQSLTRRPVKGMLTGPVTILQWSFVRDDQPRRDTCFQLALAIRDETQDLEAAGCPVIQIDEPALREGLPLRQAQAAEYLRWAVDAFRLASSGVKDHTQIHTHMCYAEFNQIIEAMIAMDADVISIESARSQMELLDTFSHHAYPNEIGPGVYDIHSPRVPTTEEVAALIGKALRAIPRDRLWVNPDCGLKTRRWEEVRPALRALVAATLQVRAATGTQSVVDYAG
jgi:5-methyltetrahydropteroyltriglutamate--homocysteine methyltransferase